MSDFPTVTIGGVGGIGSWLSFFLGRIGVPMYLYAMDRVDYTNMGGQLFHIGQIGMGKESAVIENIRDFSGGDLKIIPFGRFEPGYELTPITFSCFDNMKSRSEMVDSWYDQHGSKNRIGTPTIFIDGRMSVESFQIIAVTPDRYEEYKEKYIFPDADVADPVCSMKATSHIGAQIGSQMTQVFTNLITNHNLNLDLRDIPFFQAYEASFISNIN
jgi:hypothetical protein